MGERSSGSFDRVKREKIWYWSAAILFFLVMVLTVVLVTAGRKSQAPSVVVFGDSIYAYVEGWVSVCERLQDKSGLTVQDGAFGGTCMARQDTRSGMNTNRDTLSMAALSRAVVSEDFLSQQSVRPSEPVTWYFPDRVDGLDTVDFDKVKILILAYGMNDYQCGIPVEDAEEPMRETTYAGALRMTIRLLQDRYPDLRILLVTPTYSWYPDRGLTCEEFDPGGGLLEDYVNKELEIAGEYGVEILDFYHDFYPCEKMEDWPLYTRDGVHPNDAGLEKIASAITDYLEENP